MVGPKDHIAFAVAPFGISPRRLRRDGDRVAAEVGDGERAGCVEAETFDKGGVDLGRSDDLGDGELDLRPDVRSRLFEDARVRFEAVSLGGMSRFGENVAVVIDEGCSCRARAAALVNREANSIHL